jgi:hypothetical protein
MTLNPPKPQFEILNKLTSHQKKLPKKKTIITEGKRWQKKTIYSRTIGKKETLEKKLPPCITPTKR